MERLGATVGFSGTGTTLLGGKTEEDAGMLAVTMAVTVTAVPTVTANAATRELKTAISSVDCKRVWFEKRRSKE